MKLVGHELAGGSAYSVPYLVWWDEYPEETYEVIQSWDAGEPKFLVAGKWVDSWAEVEKAIQR